MIWDSGPWKRELARLVLALQRRKRQKRWNQASASKLEREVFYAAYVVRKLIEAFKVSHEVEALTMDGTQFPPAMRAVDFMNWDRIDELYDLSKPKAHTLTLVQFCNQIIHSFILIPYLREGTANLDGLFLSSDRQTAKSLLYFDIDQIIELLNTAVYDEIVSIESHRDANGKPMKVVRKPASCRLRP